ncbi:YfaZ family outer membrane protein [Shewanella sp. FJAT-52076]|uniref:YfaZ family outer membrane protein n=1 Tax=Shewanella sp. FJAT-52076 TaxID=2864202 RepID=UPI001C656FA0|nr:YfaZ family outer membrane protein [Shewanella sp. FJAT-52076]QYJ76455.1 YfaZ family protein [Shewanella sp. FJAT-52076]
MTLKRTFSIATPLLLSLGVLSSAAHAIDMGMELNDDRASVSLGGQLTPSARLEGEYLYVDGDNHLLQSALLFSHSAGPHRFEFGPMASRVWLDNSPNGSMLSLGGKYQLALGNGLSLKATGFVSPSVLSFSGVDGHYQWSTAVGYELNPNLGFEAGYRQIRIQYDDHRNRDLEDGFYVGANFRF